MFLPMINNRNPKQTDKGGSYGDPHAINEEFGLGIQVIKIQSSKAIDPNPPKQKRTTKAADSIPQQPSVPAFKRTPILPSLSTDKKAKTGGLSDTFKDRKATVQKKKLVIPSDSIKEFEDRPRPLEKKIISVQQVNKGIALEQQNILASQKFIIQKHYRTSMNEVLNFYERFDERQSQNLKEIRKLKKGKEINNEQQLAQELKWKQNKAEMAMDMAHRDPLTFYEPEQLYEEFSLSNYTQGGFQFKYHDVQPDFQY